MELTQYLRPNGHKTQVNYEAPEEIENLAAYFCKYGGRFECEVLTTGQVSITSCHSEHPYGDIAIEICQNGPEVNEATNKVVKKSIEWLKRHEQR